MDRARPRLIALLAPLVLVLASACTSTSGGPAAGPTPPTTTTATTTAATTTAGPKPSGYPLPRGRQVQIAKAQTGTVTLSIGDVLAVHRPTSGTRPSGGVLVLAEVTDSQLIFQAVAGGRATLSTDDPPPPPICKTTPCPPGRAAPPVLTVEVGMP